MLNFVSIWIRREIFSQENRKNAYSISATIKNIYLFFCRWYIMCFVCCILFQFYYLFIYFGPLIFISSSSFSFFWHTFSNFHCHPSYCASFNVFMLFVRQMSVRSRVHLQFPMLFPIFILSTTHLQTRYKKTTTTERCWHDSFTPFKCNRFLYKFCVPSASIYFKYAIFPHFHHIFEITATTSEHISRTRCDVMRSQRTVSPL